MSLYAILQVLRRNILYLLTATVAVPSNPARVPQFTYGWHPGLSSAFFISKVSTYDKDSTVPLQPESGCFDLDEEANIIGQVIVSL